MKPSSLLVDPAKTDVLRQLGRELDAEFIEPRDAHLGSARIHGGVQQRVGPWLATLCSHSNAIRTTLVSHHTQAHVCYVAQFDFHFSISRRGLLLDVLKTLRVLRDVEVGYPDFDEAFIICANNDEAVKTLLADAALREKIQSHPPMTLLNQYKDAQIVIGPDKLPKNVDVLVLEVQDEVVDPERLKAMLELLVATLERLSWMGVALQQPAVVAFPGPLGFTPLVFGPPPA